MTRNNLRRAAQKWTAKIFALSVLFALNSSRAEGGKPWLIHAHAHNDYLHEHPLQDALAQGFCSVEADIHLVDGQLLVAHERGKTSPERSLQALYLNPLRERVTKNHGRVYPGGPEFTLLIDLKTNWPAIYPALRATLTNYADMLVTFHGLEKQSNAVLVIITGNRSPAMFASETKRLAAMDGALEDLEENPPASLKPWISIKWSSQFQWRGVGAMGDDEKKKLTEIVTKAHRQNRLVRFWGAPDNVAAWRELRSAEVDLINTDDLSGVRNFLDGKSAR